MSRRTPLPVSPYGTCDDPAGKLLRAYDNDLEIWTQRHGCGVVFARGCTINQATGGRWGVGTEIDIQPDKMGTAALAGGSLADKNEKLETSVNLRFFRGGIASRDSFEA